MQKNTSTLTARIERSTLENLKERARRENRTLSSLVGYLLTLALDSQLGAPETQTTSDR